MFGNEAQSSAAEQKEIAVNTISRLGSLVAFVSLMPPTPNTPEKPAADKTPAAQPVLGRWIFGAPVFKPSDSSKVNVNDRTKVKSQKLANVVIPILHNGKDSGFYSRGSIYADLKPGAKVAVARFTFFGANMQSSVGTETESARVLTERAKVEIAQAYGVWRKANLTEAQTIAPEAVALDGFEMAQPESTE